MYQSLVNDQLVPEDLLWKDSPQDRRGDFDYLLEVLDCVAIAARVRPPVEQAQVIARAILAVLGKHDARAAMRALLNARAQPFDRTRCTQS